MDGFGFFSSIIFGGLAGWIASIILRIRTNIFLNIILGILGAVVVNFLLERFAGGTFVGFWQQIVIAIIGAGILMLILRAITGSNRV